MVHRVIAIGGAMSHSLTGIVNLHIPGLLGDWSPTRASGIILPLLLNLPPGKIGKHMTLLNGTIGILAETRGSNLGTILGKTIVINKMAIADGISAGGPLEVLHIR